jgi:hypothetical protein
MLEIGVDEVVDAARGLLAAGEVAHG